MSSDSIWKYWCPWYRSLKSHRWYHSFHEKHEPPESLSNALPNKRKDNHYILFEILLCLAVTAKLKTKPALPISLLPSTMPSYWLNSDEMYVIIAWSQWGFFLNLLCVSCFLNIQVKSWFLFITTIFKTIWCSNWISCQIFIFSIVQRFCKTSKRELWKFFCSKDRWRSFPQI